MLDERSFYFLKEEYFRDFPDKNFSKNHEIIDNKKHGRPYFYVFKDKNNPNIYWFVPVSSKVDKYKALYEKKVKKYGRCDTIHFGKVAGKENAFLIQNICPVTEKYVDSKYQIKNKSVHISYKLQNTLYNSGNKMLYLTEMGYQNFIFPDVLKIKQELIEQLELEKQKEQEQQNANDKENSKDDSKSKDIPKQDSEAKEKNVVQQDKPEQNTTVKTDEVVSDKTAESKQENAPKVRKRKLELIGIKPPQITPIRRRPKKVNKEVEAPVNAPKKRKLVLETNKGNSNERGRGR